MLKYPYRYKLHQYLKYAHQWCCALAYKGDIYTLKDDGRIVKENIRKKMLKYPYRYKLHQYLKYAHQWCCALAYKGDIYTLKDDGRIVKENDCL